MGTPANLLLYNPANYVREDWDTNHCIDALESRARGYSGQLREILCTSAEALRYYQREIKIARDELDETHDELRAQVEQDKMAAEEFNDLQRDSSGQEEESL